MADLQVLVVAGTHGNEINAPWLIKQWRDNPNLIDTKGIRVIREIGNPESLKEGIRYLDRDLNRSFKDDLLNSPTLLDREVIRARELIDLYGIGGFEPSHIAIDLHTTTSSMGGSLVLYGRRDGRRPLRGLLSQLQRLFLMTPHKV